METHQTANPRSLNKAVFLDRDNTIIEDHGFLSDPAGLRLLPGVERALKGLAQAGYKLVVVTNQSGVARGLITEQALAKVHEELQRQLAEHGAQLDAIYYCPYLPEGSVQEYARDSDERKPKPGMLLRAAEEMNIDLSASWMVGDSPRDVEAGQRAGCQTVRVRIGPDVVRHAASGEDEDVQADFTVRNLVDAARVIMRETSLTDLDRDGTDEAAGDYKAQAPLLAAARTPSSMTDNEILFELLQQARQLTRMHHQVEFSVTKLIAGICQGVAGLALIVGTVRFIGVSSVQGQWGQFWMAMAWLAIAAVLQLAALTFFIMGRKD
ncbi:MAG: HAD family hydrolase [Planctomycetes bacterium]|nr:HAD family hydrolase [Planctomycetota bacterium]